MQGTFWKKAALTGGIFLLVWLALRYLMPVLMPFLLGLGLALAAEPAVRFAQGRLHMKRALAGALPDAQNTVSRGMNLLQAWLMDIAGRLPAGLGSVMGTVVAELFGGGTALLQRLTGGLTGVLSAVLGWLPKGALGLGTGILAAFMISARLPKLKAFAAARLPGVWKEKYAPALGRVRRTLGGWLKAQGMLLLVTYTVVTVGFLLLGISYGPVWALLVAFVDAIPILGTGTVLLPWALVELLQGQHLRAIGLLLTYGAALLLRTTLEPKLVGRHLGLDPLLTLVFLYMGYRFFGILGMVFAPMVAAAAKSLTEPGW